MSNNLVSQQFSVASSQGKVETISEKLDPSVQRGWKGLGNSAPSLHNMSTTNVHMGSTGSGLLSPGLTSQQMSASNMDPRLLNLVSSQIGSSLRLISTQKSGEIESQSCNSVIQPFFVPHGISGGTGTLLSNLTYQQVSSKRKTPMEFPTNGIAAQKLTMPNKRMASMEHRPWLQSISELNKGSIQMQTSSVSPRMQYLPMLGKKTVQVESVSSKSGKQMATKKLSAQTKPPPKPQNDSFESVRSKMRESLASALALVQQQVESSNEVKILQSQNAISPGKTQVGSQVIESALAASGVDAPVSEGNAVPFSTSKECFIQKESNEQASACEISVGSKTSDAKNFDAQESEFIRPFPHDDIPFCNNVLAKDDLLQGNGLSWLLDIEVEYGEEKEIEVTEAPHSDEAKLERIKGKSLQDPQLLAFKIEAELLKLFGSVNKKYKEKGRSLLFNLKDKNNPELREKVMYGEIPPERLCSMSTEELASKELSEWRQAKAEELAQMIILPNTDVDIRRLVRKTHKGEFQVEVEPVDGDSMEVSVGSGSLSWSQKESPSPAKAIGKKNEASDSNRKNKNQRDQGTPCTITIPSNEGTDPMQGITVDDEMKDAIEFLPPIVSLNEFMESLDSEPPFDNLSADGGKETHVPNKSVTEGGYNVKSPEQTAGYPIDSLPAESGSTDAGSSKMDSDLKSSSSDVKSETTASVVIPMGDHVWEGVLQLSVSSVTSVVSVFKSGERTSAKEWPVLLKIKGRVRLDAFEKFLQQLPNSRSRAVMVMYLVCKEDSPKRDRSRLSEEAESYVSDGRVGYAEPASGVELYLCPPNGKTPDILSKIVPKDQFDFFKSLDDGLIGVVVWRRRPQLTSTVSPNSASHHKHNSSKMQQYSSYRKHQEMDSSMNINVTKSTIRSISMSQYRPPSPPPLDDDDDDDYDDYDDDVPPGFGPGVARDEDDLPEFNFSSGGHFMAQTPAGSHSVDQVRELINKYGKPKPSWNDDHDDADNDIPEWQPQFRPNPLQQPGVHPVHSYHQTTQTVNQVYGGSMVRPATLPQPQQHQGAWWTRQAGGEQTRCRGF